MCRQPARQDGTTCYSPTRSAGSGPRPVYGLQAVTGLLAVAESWSLAEEQVEGGALS